MDKTETPEKIMPKKAHAALSQREGYRSIFHSSPIPILVKDFSVLHKLKKELAATRYRSLAAYLARNRDLLLKTNEKARTVDANQAALDLF
ncbi:MAG: hypothetical protein K8I00_06115, partial [Candidatus Omnitrophica bacterium]|nr:hypothetical protein [Candidatus Omnitrophota bacterium]